MTTGYIRVGRIGTSHGLDGEMTASLAPGVAPEALLGLRVWLVPPPLNAARTGVVTRVRGTREATLLSLDSVGSVAEARGARGARMLASATDITLPEEPPGLEGYEVVDTERGLVGTITETLVTGANDVWVLSGPYGQVLIPVIDDVVGAIDDVNRRIEVQLLPGLIEEDS